MPIYTPPKTIYSISKLIRWLCLSLLISSNLALAKDDEEVPQRISRSLMGNVATQIDSSDIQLDLDNITYAKQVETLRGLTGVYIFTDYVFAVKNSITVDRNLTDTIENKLRDANIRVYSKEEVKDILGQPEIQIYLSVIEGEKSCCLSMWMSLLQGSAILRNPKLMKRMGTWGSGEGRSCESGRSTGDVETMILKHVDKFIVDYLSVNKEPILDKD